MKKLINIILILGFLFVDFLFFHDVFKPGESISVAQYLTGILSIIVIALALHSLVTTSQSTLGQRFTHGRKQ